MSALRIITLEHQSRPARSLLEAEAGAGGGEGDQAAGGFGASFLESIFRPNPTDNRKEKDDKIFFDRVEVYLSERRYVIKVAAALVRATLSGPTSKCNAWGDLGDKFTREVLSPGWSDFAIKLVAGIDARWFEAGTRETGLPAWIRKRMEEPTIRDQVAYAWEKQTFLEIMHLLQLMFILLYKPAENVNAELVTKWFLLMTKTQFFGREGRPTVRIHFSIITRRFAENPRLCFPQIPISGIFTATPVNWRQ